MILLPGDLENVIIKIKEVHNDETGQVENCHCVRKETVGAISSVAKTSKRKWNIKNS